MTLDKEQTYNSPQGKHRCMIVDVTLQRDKNGEEELKVLWEIISATHPIRTYMARRVFKSSEAREILDMLYELVGDDIDNIIGPNRKICADGLQMLRWKESDIEIIHIPNPRHEHPFCKVTRITAPGKLVTFPKEDTE